eukprot:Blabericola_migrator_1__11864@NODE_722_length_6730_cov_58_989494_g520_i0_p4_GENE_NODE_722_length_6730_cov_58_989494_g520_i0NODE_722_length_6730_cov_58_989494_g520_i0_p4_ORF_typecomplete_len172_score9_81_NODE_722_length_6730_cov_58_989494_g520_i043314846
MASRTSASISSLMVWGTMPRKSSKHCLRQGRLVSHSLHVAPTLRQSSCLGISLKSYFITPPPRKESRTPIGSLRSLDTPRSEYVPWILADWENITPTDLTDGASSTLSSTRGTESYRRRRKTSDSALGSDDTEAFRTLVAKGRRLECSRLWCIGRTATRRRFMDVQLVRVV